MCDIVNSLRAQGKMGIISISAFLIFALNPNYAFVQELETTPLVVESVETTESTEDTSDHAAVAYAQKCMGCHTIGGGAISGPDLKPSASWPVNNLRDAVVRMEKNVGLLNQEDVEMFTQFLLAPDAAERLAAEQQRSALKLAAQMEPGDAGIGRGLFMGKRHFANGGLSCVSCHQAEGKGGNLAMPLEDVFTRLGEAPLISACEKPGFPVMRAIYEKKPLSKQEALHVVKYLEEVSTEPQTATVVPLHMIGMIGAVGLMLLLDGRKHKRAAGTRARMVAEAHRKNNLGGAGR